MCCQSFSNVVRAASVILLRRENIRSHRSAEEQGKTKAQDRNLCRRTKSSNKRPGIVVVVGTDAAFNVKEIIPNKPRHSVEGHKAPVHENLANESRIGRTMYLNGRYQYIS